MSSGAAEPEKTGVAVGMERGGIGTPNDQTIVEAFGDLGVAVMTERDDDGERLIRELQRLRMRVQHVWPVPQQIPVGFDVIYCDMIQDLPRRLPWIPGEPGSALILIISEATPLDLKLLHNCAADTVLHYPATAAAIQTSLALAYGHFLYERRLRGRIDKLDDNLRTMRSVERAKSILMRDKSFSEEEAYHYLRRQAMRRRVTIGTIANAIIEAQELLG